MRIIFSWWFLGFALLWAQGKASPAPQVVPIDQEPMHKLVFENEYVRVFSVEVPPGGETKFHRHERDYVSVMLGDAEVESVRLREAAKAFKFTDGETLFTTGGFAHKAVNKGEKPFRNVTVELKKGGPEEVNTFGCRVSQQGILSCNWVSKLGQAVKLSSRAVQATLYEVAVEGPFVNNVTNADFGIVVFLSDGGLRGDSGEPFAVSTGMVLPVTAVDSLEYRNIGPTTIRYLSLAFPFRSKNQAPGDD